MKDKNNIHNNDIFSESIKNKLENYQMPLDESVWKGIEKKLAPKKNRIVPFWFWLSGGVAASFLVILLLQPFNNASEKIAKVKTTKTNAVEIANVDNAAPKVNLLAEKVQHTANTTTIQKTMMNVKAVKNTTIETNNPQVETQQNDLKEAHKDENLTNNIIQNKLDFQAKEADLGLANSDLQVKDSIPAEKNTPKLASLPEMPEILALPKEKKKKKNEKNWLLAANFSTTGNTDFSFANGDMYASEPQSTAGEAYGNGLEHYANSAKAYIMQPTDFNHVEYLNPVSVGFMVQKGISPGLSLSSGLVYTFLRSNYSLDQQWQQADASLDLHYLGIPLNMNVMIADKKHWNYYLSFGGMIEKGIRSVYKQNIRYNSSSLHETNVYAKIDGVQTSANAAFGIGYKLHKNWNLFFEPKIIYYFNNNQPMSARTETPLNLGFNSGLKVGF